MAIVFVQECSLLKLSKITGEVLVNIILYTENCLFEQLHICKDDIFMNRTLAIKMFCINFHLRKHSDLRQTNVPLQKLLLYFNHFILTLVCR